MNIAQNNVPTSSMPKFASPLKTLDPILPLTWECLWWSESGEITKTVANGLVRKKNIHFVEFWSKKKKKKGAHFNFAIQEISSIGYHLLWPLKDRDLVILVRSDSGLSFAWVRQVKVRVKSSPFKLWQVLAIPCSTASFFFFILPPQSCINTAE